ncbi:MAG TPA: gamma-glutamyltransferase [Woeseiaceae bacterium]|nr:gamma-glutamyltransferase [Woeseiaceae bacterium]
MTRVAVATSSQLAADAASEVSRSGGNAVDCALAASLVTMNTQPGVCALAGGAYVTVWAQGSPPVTIDGNVAVPGQSLAPGAAAAGTPVRLGYGGGVDTVVGAGSVAVPGSLAAVEFAWRRYGAVPWAKLLGPSIRAARDGFPLPSACHYYLCYSGTPVFGRSADGYGALHDDGLLRAVGSTVYVPHLADSLEAIASEGSRVFYEGEIASKIAGHIQQGGGALTLDDLRNYEPIVRDCLCVEMNDWHIATNPPPAVGGAVLAAMLLAFRERRMARWDAAALEYLMEVQRAALSWRRQRLDLSEDVAADAARLLELAGGGRLVGTSVSASTVHTSAVDDSGLGCSITASSGYGSGEMPDGTGLWLNNCLGELELNRRGPGALPVGARLSSNMAPTIARSTEGVLSVGTPGADRITTALHQFLVNFLVIGLRLDNAIAHPRMHVDLASGRGRVALEPGLAFTPDTDLEVALFPEIGMYFGGVGAALYDRNSGFTTGADPRREGATFISS